MTPLDPIERGIEITNKLRKKRKSQSSIARQQGVSHTAVWKVIYGQSESKRLKQAIAKAVGETVEDLWPSDKHKRSVYG